VLAVPQGYVVLEAAARSAKEDVAPSDSRARFYVLRDRVALSGKDIKDPQQGFNTTNANQPDVEFRFTNAGKTAFHDVTRLISQPARNCGCRAPTRARCSSTSPSRSTAD
jgi:SecD/SecF fusion protein